MNGNRWTLAVTWSLLVLALVLMGLMAGQSGHAQPVEVAAPRAELRVCTEGPPACDYAAIQDAVDAAAEGDVVKVAAGVYTGVQARPAPPGYDGPAVIVQVVYLSKTLSIQGGYTLTNWTEPDPEANPTTLDAEGQGRVLLIAGTISPTVEGLRFTGGDATGLGGGHWEYDAGGGVYVVTATATISGCVVYSNTASTADDGHGGGVYLYYSAAMFQGNTVQGNTASTTRRGGGGGLCLHASDATLRDNTVQGNTANGDGGGLYLYYSDATLQGNTVQGNTAGPSGDGGGLYLSGSAATIEGNMVVSNTASTANRGYGGGVYLYYSAATLLGNTVQGNTASIGSVGYGGGLFLYENEGMLLQGNLVQGNIASTAGSGYGGGLFLCYNHDMLFQNNTVQGNTASTASSGYGGGLHLDNNWDVLLQGNRVQGNAATLSPTATGEGGGLWIVSSGGMPMISNMVADNHANSHGSGIFTDSGPNLLHTTFARNTGGDGSGIYVSSGSADLANTVLVSQAVGIYVEYGTATLEGTLWHGNGANTGGDGTIITGTVNVYGAPAFVDPGTGDYHISPGSAAIDAGVDAGVTVDVDGDPRPMGAGHDIGADEYPAAFFHLHKVAWPLTVNPGGLVTYTLSITNAGAFTATNVRLTDTLPLLQRAVDMTTTRGSCVTGAGWGAKSTCDLGTMAPGEFAYVTFTAQATTTLPARPERVMRNVAQLTAAEPAGWSAYAETTIQDCHVRLNDSPVSYPTIQAAVDASSQPGDVVKVAGYCTGALAQGPRQVVYLDKTLTLQGGWNLSFTQQSVVSYPTTVDALEQGRVLYVVGDTSPTVEGLRLTGGNAADLGRGGGVYVHTATATISNCVIYSNTSGGDGGGVSLQSSATTMYSNTVRGNTSGDEGGGLYLWDSAALLVGNNVSANLADGNGGGLSLYYSDATLDGNNVKGNTASRSGAGSAAGGGLYAVRSNVILNDNLIAYNESDGGGGGLYLEYSPSTVSGNTIISNKAKRVGGAGFAASGSTLINNIVADNWASGLHSSGLKLTDADYHLLHNTIARNTGGDGVGIYVHGWPAGDDVVVMRDTIVVGHEVGIYVELEPTIIMEGTLWGSGEWANDQDWDGGGGTVITGTINIYDDPAFVDPDAGDYHLGPGSAAINAGVDAGITVDIDGDPRPLGLSYDIGADEFDGPVLAIVKEADPDLVAAGSQLTYTLRLTNTGTVSLTATITDLLPVHVTPGGVLVWMPAPLQPGEVWSETVVVTVDVDYAGLLTNVVHATAKEGATGMYTRTVAVEAPVVGLAATNDSPTVLGEPTTLTATIAAGTNASYAWAFGDGELGSGATVSHVYPEAGIYTAVVTASNSVSELTATTTVTITDVPIEGLVATNDSPTVLGEPTTLMATVAAGSNASCTWTLGDGTSGSGAVVAHTYPAVGEYTAVVTASNSVSELTATTTVVVEEAIAGLTATNDSPTVWGEVTTLTATVTAGSNVTYTWAFGDGELGSGATVSHVYPEVGIYTAVVTASNGVSELAATTTVVVEEAIEGLVATNDSPTVLGEPTTLTATVTAGSNVTYTWALDAKIRPDKAVVTHTFPAVGVYTIVVTASNSVSELTATTTVTITDEEIPIEGLAAANDSPTVLGEATTLTATVTAGSNVTYTWALGDGTSGGGAVVTHIYSMVGIYTAVVTASNSVSELTATTTVTITDEEIPIEGLMAVNDSPTVPGEATTLTATVTAGSNVSYTWTLGDGTFDGGPAVTHIYPVVGVYTAVVTASNSAGELTATTRVTIAAPEFSIYLPLVLRQSP